MNLEEYYDFTEDYEFKEYSYDLKSLDNRLNELEKEGHKVQVLFERLPEQIEYSIYISKQRYLVDEYGAICKDTFDDEIKMIIR